MLCGHYDTNMQHMTIYILVHATPPDPPQSQSSLSTLQHPSSLNVIPPLTKHPHQAPCTHNHRPRKRLPPSRRLKDKPLAPKVRKCNDIRPNRKLIKRRIVDIVGRIKTYDRCEECPGTECARAEPGYMRRLLDWWVHGGWVVDARGVG
jgi:hypothetical protein